MVKHSTATVFAGYQLSVGLKYGITEEDTISAPKNCLKIPNQATIPLKKTNKKNQKKKPNQQKPETETKTPKKHNQPTNN